METLGDVQRETIPIRNPLVFFVMQSVASLTLNNTMSAVFSFAGVLNLSFYVLLIDLTLLK